MNRLSKALAGTLLALMLTVLVAATTSAATDSQEPPLDHLETRGTHLVWFIPMNLVLDGQKVKSTRFKFNRWMDCNTYALAMQTIHKLKKAPKCRLGPRTDGLNRGT